MVDQLNLNRRSVARSCVLFGAGILIIGAMMSISIARYPRELIRPGEDRPMLSVELAGNDDALRSVLGNGDERVHSQIALNTYLDFVFIFLYAGFLITFTISTAWRVDPRNRAWILIIQFSIIVAVLADLAENVGILHALSNTDRAARLIFVPAMVKWSLLSLIVALLGLLLYQASDRISGVAFALFGGLMAAGLAFSHDVLQIAMLLALLLGLGKAFIFWRQVARSFMDCHDIPIGRDLALREEYQHIFGVFDVTDEKSLLNWISSEDPLAMTIAGRMRTKGLSTGQAEAVGQYLGEFADSLGLLSERFSLKRDSSDERHSRATRFQKGLHRMKQTLGIKGSERHLPVFGVRQQNQHFLQSRCPGIKLRDFDDREILERLKPSALCLSGGGIRSATFNLGILQGLARHFALERFTYLSTVSGGGFIGGWLSALKLRSRKTAINGPHVPEVRYLRDFSNYLTPQAGLLSADTWTLVTIYFRNLLLTWVVLLPCIAVALMLPRFFLWLYTGTPVLPVQYAFLSTGIVALMLGIGYIGAHLPSNRLESSPSRHTLRSTAKWSGLATVVITDLICFSRPGVSWRWMIPVVVFQLILLVPLLRSAKGGQLDFIDHALVPILTTAISFTACWHWLPAASRLRSTDAFLLGGTVAVLVPWSICAIAARKAHMRSATSKPTDESMNDFDFQVSVSLLLLPTGALLASALGRFIATRVWFDYSAVRYAIFSVPVVIGIFLIAGTLMAGLISLRTSDDDEEWWARAGAWLLIAAVVWLTATTSVLYLPGQLMRWTAQVQHAWNASQFGYKDILKIAVAAFGAISAVASAAAGFSAKTGNMEGGRGVSKSLTLIAPIGAAIGLLYILVYLSAATDRILDSISRNWNIAAGDPWLLLGLALAFLALGSVAGALINTNKFSLHYYWRNRIVRAYLGASNTTAQRKANAFTNFGECDDIQMYELRDQQPFHILNVALNLTHSGDLAFQERKAEPFTVSPLHCGAAALGYRDSRLYARARYSGKEGISLGTAMALSGAAVSPNMGYMVTSPVLRFLMTLFNLRLGAWLGNPGKSGNTTFQNSSPKHSINPIIREALGYVGDRSPYVYLSDGGHFENLGLYEMVRRRCLTIFVSDATTDPEYDFESFAVSVRKIRVDFGIPIEIHRAAPIGKFRDKAGSYFALGTIAYSRVFDMPDGKLIYVKASLTGAEPEDVRNYSHSHDPFPQESIADQFFTESQFESYRELGDHIVTHLCSRPNEAILCQDLDDLFDHLAERSLLQGEDGVTNTLLSAIKKAASA